MRFVCAITVLLFPFYALHAQHGIVITAGGGPSPIGVTNTSTGAASFLYPGNEQLRQVAPTHDGSAAYFLSNSPGEVLLVDLTTGAVKATIEIPSLGPIAIALSPDGSRLYMVGSGGPTYPLDVFVIDTSTNLVTRRVSLADALAPLSGYQIAVSLDGSKLFVPSTDDPSHLYVLSTTNLQTTATIQMAFSLSSLAVTPNALFVGGSSGGQAYVAYMAISDYSLWNTFTLFNSACAGSLAANPNGLALYAMGSGCGSAGEEIYEIYPPSSAVLVENQAPYTQLVLSPDGNTLYASLPGGIAVLNGTTLARAKYFPQPGVVEAIAVSPDGSHIIAANSGSSTFFYTDPATGAPLIQFQTGPANSSGTVNALTTCNASETTYAAETTGNLGVFDNTILGPAAQPNLPTGVPPGLFACPGEGGPFIILSNQKETIYEFSASGSSLNDRPLVGSHFTQVAIAPDASNVFASSQSGSPETIRVFDRSLGTPTWIPAAAPFPIAFSSDSQHTYVGNYSVPTASILDIDTHTLKINRTIPLPDPLATSITVSPDGKTLYVLANVNMDVVDLGSGIVSTYPVGFSVYHIPIMSAMSPDGTKIHIVENGEYSVLSVFDTGTRQITSRVEYPSTIAGVAFTTF